VICCFECRVVVEVEWICFDFFFCEFIYGFVFCVYIDVIILDVGFWVWNEFLCEDFHIYCVEVWEESFELRGFVDLNCFFF